MRVESIGVLVVFFFKQKTAYEIKECDWSSDVCSSDLDAVGLRAHRPARRGTQPPHGAARVALGALHSRAERAAHHGEHLWEMRAENSGWCFPWAMATTCSGRHPPPRP